MHSEKEKSVAETTEIKPTLETTEQLDKVVEDLRAELDALSLQLNAMGRKSTGRIALAFAVPGAISLVVSILVGSQILAFIGLGLTFWGAVFYLVRPITYVRGSLLGLTAESVYSTIDRIIRDLDCKGKALYVPPYPREVYLPEHLIGLKETIAFISVNENTTMPSIEEIARSKFMTKNPKGILLIPPGSSLLQQIERNLRTDVTKMSLEDLCTNLPQIILENFQFAKEIQMRAENKIVSLRITDSIYRNLYLKEDLKTVRLLGCPLASAIAGAITKSVGKPAYIQSVEVSPDALTVEISYAFMEE
jgi:hypothetical protein